MHRNFFDQDQEAYRETVKAFLAREVAPHYEDWESEGIMDRSVFTEAGKAGIIGLAIPEKHGGSAVTDYRYRTIVAEELARGGYASLATSFAVQDDMATPYIADLGTEEQKHRWLPGLSSGELVGAVAMTEPNAGSDLQGMASTATTDGSGGWILNGQKTFISNGILADLVVVAAKTDRGTPNEGLSLFVLERETPGFTRGRKLRKVGLASQDTAELTFTDVHLGPENLLGQRGRGFFHLTDRLPLERLSIAVSAVAAAKAAYDWTATYAFERRAFGTEIGNFQNTRFVLAEILTEVEVSQTYVDSAVQHYNQGTLNAVDAAKVKWWATELQKRTVDRCVQLHGGYGYMLEYPIGRAYADSRIQTIYGGTTEIMKEIIGRDIAKRANI